MQMKKGKKQRKCGKVNEEKKKIRKLDNETKKRKQEKEKVIK